MSMTSELRANYASVRARLRGKPWVGHEVLSRSPEPKWEPEPSPDKPASAKAESRAARRARQHRHNPAAFPDRVRHALILLEQAETVTPHTIRAACARAFDLTDEEVASRNKRSDLVCARGIGVALAHRLFNGISYERLGVAFGLHATAAYRAHRQFYKYVDTVVGEYVGHEPGGGTASLQGILQDVARKWHFAPADIISGGRHGELAAARQEYYYRAMLETRHGCAEIAREAGRDRTTVLDGVVEHCMRTGAKPPREVGTTKKYRKAVERKFGGIG